MPEVQSSDLTGSVRPFKSYPAYKDSGLEWLGEIPAHWEVKRLWHLTPSHRRIMYGIVLPGPNVSDGVPIVKGGDVSPERLRIDLLNRTTREIESGYARSRLRGGDLVYAIRGSIGEVAIVPEELEGANLTQDAARVAYTSATHGPWLAHALKSATVFAHLEVGALGATIRGINIRDLKRAPLVVPPRAEQCAIAVFLDRETARIDELVAKKERLIGLLKEKRTALITGAVTKGLDPSVPVSETSSVVFPQIPTGWNLRKLRRLITRVTRPVRVDPDAEYREIGIRSWGKGIFHKDAVRGALLEEKSVFRIEPGDFVLNIVFAWEGAVAVATDAERGMVGSHRFPTFRCSDEIDLDYLLMVLQTEQGRTLMEVNSPGAAGRNKTIRMGQFLDEAIPLPPVEEQRQIIRQFRDDEVRLLALINQLSLAIQRLKELRTALISAAVAGKIDVREVAA